MGKYVKLITGSGTHIASVSIAFAESKLPDNNFCRIHKSYIISLRSIKYFDIDLVHIDDQLVLPIGRCFREALLQKASAWGKNEHGLDHFG